MKTITQIVALTTNGNNMIWHETLQDFVSYHIDVPNTEASEFKYALEKAVTYEGIKNVWMEIIDAETNQLIATNL